MCSHVLGVTYMYRTYMACSAGLLINDASSQSKAVWTGHLHSLAQIFLPTMPRRNGSAYMYIYVFLFGLLSLFPFAKTSLTTWPSPPIGGPLGQARGAHLGLEAHLYPNPFPPVTSGTAPQHLPATPSAASRHSTSPHFPTFPFLTLIPPSHIFKMPETYHR